jgi:hypothetical protein
LLKALNATELNKNYSKNRRDCFPAALSCIVPYAYESMPKLKHLHVKKILYPRGRERWAVWCRRHNVRFEEVFYIPTDRYYIGLYVVPAHGELHAVVCYNGEIVHNPAVGMDRWSMKGQPMFKITVHEEVL